MTKLVAGAVAALSMVSLNGPAGAAGPEAQYVAMGSSYSAGPGVGVPDAASGECYRSMSNFARLVAAKRHLELKDVSCSGATTVNVLEHGQHEARPQVSYVTAGTRFVSVLIGGNDIDYVGNLDGLSCRDTGGGCHVTDAGDVTAKLAALPASLDRVVAEVRRRAPAATIVLVGYLPVVPADGAGPCAALPLTPADAARMRGVAEKLAQAIGGAAQRNHTGVVRSTLIGRGHDACSGQAYVAGYRPARTPGCKGPAPYHPTQAGMDAVAAELDAQFQR